ncbi:hypothetical protein BH18THE2_BH18THE2_20930 [soil metagenome]
MKSTYLGLRKAWIGYKIAKTKGDRDKMIYYAEGIHKFQKQLNAPLSDFTELVRRSSSNANANQD